MSKDPLAELRAAFVSQTALDLESIRRAHAQLAPGPKTPEIDGALDQIRKLAHGLAGRGGTFGFPDISVAGRELEDAVCVIDAAGEALTDEMRTRVEASLAKLTRAVKKLPVPAA